MSFPNLLLRNSGYYFRYVVPAPLRPIMGWEVRRALRCHRLSEAKPKARQLAACMDRLVMYVEKYHTAMELTREAVDALVKEWLDKTLQDIEEQVVMNPPATMEDKVSILNANLHQHELDADALAVHDHSQYESKAAELLKAKGLHYDTQAFPFRLLTRRLHEAYVQHAYGHEFSLLHSGMDDRSYEAYRTAVSASPFEPIEETEQPTVVKSPLMSALLEEYLKEKAVRGVQPRSLADYRPILEAFIELHGDTPLADVTRSSVIDAYEQFCRLPPNRSKMPEYREKSLREILAMNPETTISENTKDKAINRIASFFNWAELHGHIAKNPAKGLAKKPTVAASKQREAFSDNDLDKLFNNDTLRKARTEGGYKYWLPWLGLYTGARLDELCQLRLVDFYEEEGIPVIHFTPEAGKLKTTSSERTIPVHSRLIELGLLDYVARLKALGHERLFPALRKTEAGYGAIPSKWFKRYRTKCGVTARTKVFHSFRHTVATRLGNQGVEEYLIADLVGHENESITTGRYRKQAPAKHLVSVVERLKFPV